MPPQTTDLDCRWCGAPLSELQRRLGGHCGAASCRHLATQQRFARTRQIAIESRIKAASKRIRTGLQQAEKVWLPHFGATMIATSTKERTDFAAFLARVVNDPDGFPRDPAHDLSADRQKSSPADRLCAMCKGRCCKLGLSQHAFIDRELLRGYQANVGGTFADAATFYLSHLPASHVAGSCLYHSEQGCALPREARAPICNAWFCDSLNDARAAVSSGQGALLVSYAHAEVRATAWLTPDGAALIPFGETDEDLPSSA